LKRISAPERPYQRERGCLTVYEGDNDEGGCDCLSMTAKERMQGEVVKLSIRCATQLMDCINL
jgi:hypothetical protein